MSRPVGIYERPAVPVEAACVQCGRAYERHPKASRAHWCHDCAKTRRIAKQHGYYLKLKERAA